ncbi:MAG: hypothetical protein BWZ00_01836 [Bacteroidetes bacterium ADurb.BinA174]|nr:MAG: hypothetical protein BWZ00_01836 [Bacteroidetes bacterium ADurb.BinA174]
MEKKYVNNYLEDIQIAINEIDEFFSDVPKTYEEFLSNLILRRAVERNIQIIGESVGRISVLDESITITNARKYMDAGKHITHTYNSLLPDILWSIVINHLPQLKTEVETLLSEKR